MTADLKTLQALHQRLAESFLELTRVREVTKTDKDGNTYEETVYPTAAELSAAATFLKNNNITAAPETDPGLDALRQQLAERRRKRPAVDFEATSFKDLQ